MFTLEMRLFSGPESRMYVFSNKPIFHALYRSHGHDLDLEKAVLFRMCSNHKTLRARQYMSVAITQHTTSTFSPFFFYIFLLIKLFLFSRSNEQNEHNANSRPLRNQQPFLLDIRVFGCILHPNANDGGVLRVDCAVTKKTGVVGLYAGTWWDTKKVIFLLLL